MGNCDGLDNTQKFGLARHNLRTFTADTISPLQWVLLCHGGFYTEYHHDGEGTGTYVWVHTGRKDWVYFRPRASGTLAEIQMRVKKCMMLDGKDGTCYRIELRPGDILRVPFPIELRTVDLRTASSHPTCLTAYIRRKEASSAEVILLPTRRST